jgi:hypothetical protein
MLKNYFNSDTKWNIIISSPRSSPSWGAVTPGTGGDDVYPI